MLRISAQYDCIADCQNNDVYLLKRLMYPEEFVGAAYLLGNIYVVTRGSSDVLVHAGYSPYHITEKIFLDGMNAVDIATSYADICVYVLDDGNGRVSRIGQDHSVTTAIDGLERGSLLSMSVTMDGRIIIVKKGPVISTYGKDGSLINDVHDKEPITHAVEVTANVFAVCNGSAVVKKRREENLLQPMPGATPSVACTYLGVDREANLIACDRSGHKVVKLDSESLQVTATLLTLDRDGIENPQHVQYVLENGMMLVSWMNFLDVYTFTQKATGGYLASSKDDAQQQQRREAEMLESKITRTNDAFAELVHLRRIFGMECVFRDLPPEPPELELPSVYAPGKYAMFSVFSVQLKDLI